MNQTPQTIERYFGCHIIKKTHGGQVTYTYKPQSFRRVFPQFPKSNFSITLAALSTLHVQGTILHIMVP
ncbi:MAG: hypothetical protein KME23_06995 [Goleter apudmare HA4340-LM2]|nr:hypothetical protein [Goleter apudmare HA4340-LM2]